jgi:hypothetical protein
MDSHIEAHFVRTGGQNAIKESMLNNKEPELRAREALTKLVHNISVSLSSKSIIFTGQKQRSFDLLVMKTGSVTTSDKHFSKAQLNLFIGNSNIDCTSSSLVGFCR